MSTAVLTCGKTYPNGSIPLENQILYFTGLVGRGELTGLKVKLYIRRDIPGTDTLRFLITDRCTLPASWVKLTDGSCYSRTEGVDTQLPGSFFEEEDVLLDLTREVAMTGTWEYPAEVTVDFAEADTVVTDMSRWAGPLYLTVVRVGEYSSVMEHTLADNRSTITMTFDGTGYDKDSFLSGLTAGLMAG